MYEDHTVEFTKVGTHACGKGNPVGFKVPKGYVTNAEFSKTNSAFLSACAVSGVPATKRQASKWRRKFGTAYLKQHA